jgi:predicted GTPase
MGTTGSGKSSVSTSLYHTLLVTQGNLLHFQFIRFLTRDDTIAIGNGLESETSDIQVIRFSDPASGRNVTIVDTPGFDDSRDGITDTEILKRIARFLLDVYVRTFPYSFLVLRITNKI